MKNNRRNFIKHTGLAAAGTLLVPRFLHAGGQGGFQENGKRLVVIQLSGGNDGLNTVVPFRNDDYYRLRPKLALDKNAVLALDDDTGLHPALADLRHLYGEGLLAVVNGVGYPNPDRSHFRSMDIWHTASGSREYLDSGWIGRWLDAACGPCGSHAALEIDDSLSLALKGEKMKGMAVLETSRLYQSTRDPHIEALAESAKDTHHHPQAAYLYKTLLDTRQSAEILHSHAKKNRNQGGNYPATPLGKQLKTVAGLILGGCPTQVYYVSLSGFDTHIRQAQHHERLLGGYGKAVRAFADDLKNGSMFNDTLVLTFSEFGRRVKENASNGTDHGTANSVLTPTAANLILSVRATRFWACRRDS